MNTPNRQMQNVLDALTQLGPLPIESLSASLARQVPLLDRAAAALYGQNFANRALAPMPTPVGAVKHHVVTGPEGSAIIRIYTPIGETPRKGWPVIVYYHGGGWVLADLNTYDSSCRALCNATKAIVVSAHYRQAPEHPWPAALDDAVTAYTWVAANANAINGDPSKIAIAGENAGGNLAAVVSLIMRDRGGNLPIHQVLIYPVVDLESGARSPSATAYADAKPLNQAMLNWFYDQYAPSGVDRNHPYLSPTYAATLTGLPPATVILAEIDPLRSEGDIYAAKLSKAGVPVSIKIFEGVTHEFFGLSGLVAEANEAVELVAKNLKLAFGPPEVLRKSGSIIYQEDGKLPPEVQPTSWTLPSVFWSVPD